MTSEQHLAFERSSMCYMCHTTFNADISKVCDHDHFTGIYLGAACNKCNIQRRIRRPFLPVLFHNLRGYDMHHIIKHAISQFLDWDLSVIAQSSEKFLSLMVHFDKAESAVSLRFIDTLQFLNASLANLVKMLPATPLTSAIANMPDIAKSAKGIFPYSFADSQAKLEEPRNILPPLDAFYDILTESINVTEDEH